VTDIGGTRFACQLTLRDGRRFWCSTSRSTKDAAENARNAIHALLDLQLSAPRVAITTYAGEGGQLRASEALMLAGRDLQGARVDVAPLGCNGRT
jgi:hypothetical protein